MRQIRIVPGGGDSVDFSSQAVYSSVYPIWGYSSSTIPNYFTTTYITGMQSVPRDILDAVGKMATISAANVLGDVVLGAGIASSSLSIDSLSQSISTTQSATSSGMGARIIQYLKELDKELPALRDKYLGVTFTSL